MKAFKIVVFTLFASSLVNADKIEQQNLPLPYCGNANQQPCFTSCHNPKFADCPEVFITLFDPQFCAFTINGDWIDYTFECQACQNSDVVAVVQQKCSCQFTGCLQGKICQSGECVNKECTNCKQYEFCDQGTCRDNCLFIKCIAGQICQKGACVPEKISCAVTTCLNDQYCVDGVGCVPIQTENSCSLCKSYEFCSNDNVCIDKCVKIKCAAGYECQKGNCILKDLCSQIICLLGQQCVNGQCVNQKPIDPCAAITCLTGEKCLYGKCIKNSNNLNLPIDSCKGKCLQWQRCFQGQCKDNCQFLRCANCFRGKCGVIDKCSLVKCKKGEKCIDGQYIKDSSCKILSKVYCTDPRPTEVDCPTIQFVRQPDPLVCGVDAFGNRQNYPVACYACRDQKNMFYYNVPCAQVGNQNCGPLQQCQNGECVHINVIDQQKLKQQLKPAISNYLEDYSIDDIGFSKTIKNIQSADSPKYQKKAYYNKNINNKGFIDALKWW